MNTIRHLLVAFNGSEDSKEALSAGISLSKQLNAHLSVLHVYEDEPNPPVTASSTQPLYANRMSGDGMTNYPMPPVVEASKQPYPEEQYSTDGTNRITAEAQSILQQNQIKGEVKVMDGNPSDAILSYAEEIGADMIVIGQRNLSGIKKLITSSVSEKVTKESVIPVLIAK
ncbi:universal stress protein [Bacillus sp. FJAT-42376]|uniref:universal stress protein n=1 Tax=Bacillus sp. FJAT-42376 TaxID=2014076 RepID=UPI000F4EF236|nr:universal stress protein [Bacillus sp. FJAT-42376]AZB42178.1 universal stress protein [Bacillus sp. FJAT-42376]